MVDETPVSGNHANLFGTEEENTVPTDYLGLDERTSEVETLPEESEEQMQDDIIEDNADLPLGHWVNRPRQS